MPTFETVIERARADVNDQITKINGYSRELEELRQQTSADPGRVAELRSFKASAENQLPDLERKLSTLREASADDDTLTRSAGLSFPAAGLPKTTGDAVFYTSERSQTYNAGNSGLFLRDLFQFSMGGVKPEAAERLLKHERESRAAGLISERANSTTSFSGIVPPQYLVDQYALIARQGRPTANVVQHLPLPDEGMSLIVPRGTTGVTTAIQATENSTVSNTDEVWANITVPVATIAGYNAVSRQSIDRAAGVDSIVFGDLAGSYAVTLDQQVLTGTGTSGQMLGILNTPGISQASAFTAAATMATLYSKIAGQINAIQTTRYLAPDVIIMAPRRWNWILSQLDTSSRPLAVPNPNGPTNSYAVSTIPLDTTSSNAVGQMLGLDVVTDASIPVNLGTGSLEDVIIVARKEDLLLWEDPAAPFELRFEQTAGTQLSVTLVAYGYSAFTAQRYASAVGLVGGNATTSGFGLTLPVF